MMHIGILSDTHSTLHPKAFDFFREADELWHAGDIGDLATLTALRKFKPVRAVYGNVDGPDIRKECQEVLTFRSEGVQVVMMHIGGYPGRYTPAARALMVREKPGLFVCGHSHILKVMYDREHGHLHINPGAAGRYGLHQSVTMVRLTIDGEQMKDLEVLDLPRTGNARM